MITSGGAEEGGMPERDRSEPGTRIQQAGSDIAYLHASHDVFRLDLPPADGMPRRVVGLLRRVLRRLLAPVLARQATYNHVNARAASAVLELVQDHAAALKGFRHEVAERLDGLAHQQTTALEALQHAVVDALDELGRTHGDALASLPEAVLARVESRIRDLEGTVLRQRAQLDRQERQLAMLRDEGTLGPEGARTLASGTLRVTDELYLALEEEFRGSRDVIRQRMEVYLPLLKDCTPCAEGRLLVDVGCGRGEWLELLGEHGVTARGVDRNRAAVRRCRALGLDVVESDAIAFLRTVPDGTVGALTAFHVIEHLPFDGLLELLDESVRVLAPGGFALFETPNAENILVASYGFHLDPTHLRPIPSPLLRFLAEAKGLCRLEIRTLHPPDPADRVAARSEVAERFNEHFHAPRDYALIGWKA